jgi:HSP20 family protein
MFGRNKLARRENGTVEAAEHPLARLRNDIDALFSSFFHEPFGLTSLNAPFAQLGEWGPRMDVHETENNVTLKFDLPGVDPEQVDIRVADNVLTIRGERSEEKECGNGTGGTCYRERRYGSFSRSVTLPASVDPDNVDATFRNGVLTVTLNKRADARPKRITVKAG